MNKTKLYRIAENLASDLYSYQDGETNVNRIYKTVETAVYNMRAFREICNDNDRLWLLFCTFCHCEHVYQGALNQYKDSLMAMIIK